MQRIVVPTVLEFVFDSSTDFEPEIRRHGDVPAVEQRMEVTPQQETIARIVRATSLDGLDMGRLQDGEGTLAGNDAAALVQICDDQAEGSLSDPWVDESGAIGARLEHGLWRGSGRDHPRRQK